MGKELNRGRLDELLRWLKRETSFTWQFHEDETAARYGAWDNPLDREYLSDIKYRAETLGSFSDKVEDVIGDDDEGVEIGTLSSILTEHAEQMFSSKRVVAFAELLISCLSADRFPGHDEMKDIFDA